VGALGRVLGSSHDIDFWKHVLARRCLARCPVWSGLPERLLAVRVITKLVPATQHERFAEDVGVGSVAEKDVARFPVDLPLALLLAKPVALG